MDVRTSNTHSLKQAFADERFFSRMQRELGAKNRWFMIAKTFADAVGKDEARTPIAKALRTVYEEELKLASEDQEEATR